MPLINVFIKKFIKMENRKLIKNKFQKKCSKI